MLQEQHRATARVLDILERLASSEGGLTLTELAQQLEAPKSSLFPIVHTLEERRYIRQERGTGRYTMGLNALVLGASVASDRDLEPIIRVMRQVVEDCQETCQLGILDQGNVLYVEKVDSTEAIRMISWVGNRLPANATAIGKALLSGLDDWRVRALYANGLSGLTTRTITDMDILLQQLQEIRLRGIAAEREESTSQLACWAVPLYRRQEVFAALSVSVPMFRCDEVKIVQVCRCLFDAKKEIERLAEIRDFRMI